MAILYRLDTIGATVYNRRMAKHHAYCRKCHNPVDDQDIIVRSIHEGPYGEIWAHVECGWCGHLWDAKESTVKHLKQYKDLLAKHTAEKRKQ